MTNWVDQINASESDDTVAGPASHYPTTAPPLPTCQEQQLGLESVIELGEPVQRVGRILPHGVVAYLDGRQGRGGLAGLHQSGRPVQLGGPVLVQLGGAEGADERAVVGLAGVGEGGEDAEVEELAGHAELHLGWVGG